MVAFELYENLSPARNPKKSFMIHTKTMEFVNQFVRMESLFLPEYEDERELPQANENLKQGFQITLFGFHYFKRYSCRVWLS